MIKFYDRKNKIYAIEKVAGEKYLKWIYDTPKGMFILNSIVKKKLFTSLYGSYCNTSLSKRKILKFIEDLDIDISQSEKNVKDFKTFNDFFTRKLKPIYRLISSSKNEFISPADGKILCYENIEVNKIVQVKDFQYSLSELIGDETLSLKYSGGTCLIFRLCPTDYHRFHFVDSGFCSETKKIKGHYYSVNPMALQKIPKLFCQNKREYSIFKSDNFGDILYVEVGATCVGTIIQTYTEDIKVNKGAEKGYFAFGGSTVILFVEKNKFIIDEDIINQTKLGYETKVIMGETIGHKL